MQIELNINSLSKKEKMKLLYNLLMDVDMGKREIVKAINEVFKQPIVKEIGKILMEENHE